jgi:hypothetical protein
LTVSLSVLVVHHNIKIDKIGPIIGSFFIIYYKNKILLYLSNKKGMAKYININYPFKDSPKGFLLDLNSDDASAIKV